MVREGMHNEAEVSFNVAAGIPEICAFNDITRRLKSGLCSSVKVRLRCVCQPTSLNSVAEFAGIISFVVESEVFILDSSLLSRLNVI